jgi:hypothetical protein
MVETEPNDTEPDDQNPSDEIEKLVPAHLNDPTATPPTTESEIRDVVRGFVRGRTTFPEAVDDLGKAMAEEYDIPWLPEALERRLLGAISKVVLTVIEEIAV